MRYSVTITLECVRNLSDEQKEKLTRLFKKSVKRIRSTSNAIVSDFKETLTKSEQARKAGLARAQSMTASQRSELARRAANARHSKPKHKKRVRGFLNEL